jgi:hypothetical protein
MGKRGYSPEVYEESGGVNAGARANIESPPQRARITRNSSD